MAKKKRTDAVFGKFLAVGEYLNYLAGGTWVSVALLTMVYGGSGTVGALTTAVAHASLAFVCRWMRTQ